MPTLTYSGSSTTPTLLDAKGRVWQGWVDSSSTTATCSTLNVWNAWASTTTASTTTSITSTSGATTADAWVHWIQGTLATTSATSTLTWGRWVGEAEDRADRRVRIEVNENVRREAAEQRAARDAQWAEERREAEQKRKEADERAMALLRSCLSQKQLDDLMAHDHFFVTAKSGRMYRIDKGSHGNVKCVDPVTKVWTESLCAAPRGGIPAGDAMLMQKLLIETAEETFRSYANISLKAGGFISGKSGGLTGDELYNVLMFPDSKEREGRAAAAA